jgi:RNA polymerase sigma factor (sigma-70 family)
MFIMLQKSASITVRYLNALLAEQEPDPVLLQRFLARREEAAFEALVRRHGPMVLALCRRLLHQDQDAEDAFQATFLVLARKASSISRREALGSWLYGVATRIASKLRSTAARHPTEPLADVPRETDADDIGWRELSGMLDEELARLSESLRAPLILCFLEGRTQDEAARQLGWSKSTLRRRLESGRVRLRASLGRRGLTLSAALVSLMLVPESARSAVPAGLAAAAVRAAGREAPGAVSASVLALAEGILQVAPLRLARVAAVVLLAAGLAGTAGMVVGTGSSEQPSEQAALATIADPAAAAGVDEPAASEPGPAAPEPIAPPAPLPIEKATPLPADLAGDPLPPGARARLGTFRLRHSAPVVGVTFVLDRRVLFFASEDGRVSFWEAASGRPFGKAQKHAGPVALSPDGRFLAAVGEAALLNELWTGNTLFPLQDGDRPFRAVTFSPDSKSVAAMSREDTLQVWSTATGKQTGLIQGQKFRTFALAPGGRLVAACKPNGPVRLWDPKEDKEIRQYGGADETFGAVVFSADGKHLVALAGQKEKLVRVWDVVSGRLVHAWKAGATADGLAISADGRTLAAGSTLWDMATGQERGQVDEEAAALNFSPDGSMLATADGARVRLWDVATRRELFRFSGHSAGIRALAASRDGRLALTLGGDGPKMWDTTTGQERPVPGMSLHSVVMAGLTAEGGARLFGKTGDMVWCWDAVQKELARLPFEDAEFLAATPDGKTAVIASYNKLPLVWQPATGKRRVLRGLIEHGVDGAAISADGRYVAARQDTSGRRRAVCVWDLTTNLERTPLELKHSMDRVAALAFSPDGRTLAAVGEAVRIWDVARGTDRTPPGELQRKPSRLAVPYRAAAFSPSGRLLATAEESGVVCLWEVASGCRIDAFVGHRQPVMALAFAADGRTLISGSADCTAIVWDVNTLVTGKDARPVALDDLATDLAASNAGRAYRAVVGLAAAPEQAVPLLDKALWRAEAPDEAKLRRLLAALDADTFAEREQATAELRRLGKAAEAALRQALADGPSLELQQRVERLLRYLEEQSGPTQEFLGRVRAMEALEQIGTPEAQRVLENFAGRATDAELVREAKASLDRLSRRGQKP